MFTVGKVWANETAPALGYSQDRALSAANAFDDILMGEPVGDCQGYADILRMISERDEPEIARVRAALAMMLVNAE